MFVNGSRKTTTRYLPCGRYDTNDENVGADTRMSKVKYKDLSLTLFIEGVPAGGGSMTTPSHAITRASDSNSAMLSFRYAVRDLAKAQRDISHAVDMTPTMKT